jgi:hypothetical protein
VAVRSRRAPCVRRWWTTSCSSSSGSRATPHRKRASSPGPASP